MASLFERRSAQSQQGGVSSGRECEEFPINVLRHTLLGRGDIDVYKVVHHRPGLPISVSLDGDCGRKSWPVISNDVTKVELISA